MDDPLQEKFKDAIDSMLGVSKFPTIAVQAKASRTAELDWSNTNCTGQGFRWPRSISEGFLQSQTKQVSCPRGVGRGVATGYDGRIGLVKQLAHMCHPGWCRSRVAGSTSHFILQPTPFSFAGGNGDSRLETRMCCRWFNVFVGVRVILYSLFLQLHRRVTRRSTSTRER